MLRLSRGNKLYLPDAEFLLVAGPLILHRSSWLLYRSTGSHSAPPGVLIYHNLARRQDDGVARPGNAGERLAYARFR